MKSGREQSAQNIKLPRPVWACDMYKFVHGSMFAWNHKYAACIVSTKVDSERSAIMHALVIWGLRAAQLSWPGWVRLQGMIPTCWLCWLGGRGGGNGAALQELPSSHETWVTPALPSQQWTIIISQHCTIWHFLSVLLFNAWFLWFTTI